MLLLLGLLALTAWLLLVVVRGPERWHRDVVLNLRPGAPEPTRSGYALLFWRHLALLLVAVLTTYGVARADVWRSDERLLEASTTAADLVPSDELSGSRVTAEVRALAGPDVLVSDLSSRLPDLPAGEVDDEGETTDRTWLQVRWLSPLERFAEQGPGTDDVGRDAAACVVITTVTTTSVTGTDESRTARVVEGRCRADTA